MARGIRSHTGWNAGRMEGKMNRVEEEVGKTARLSLFPSLIRRGPGACRPVQRRPWQTA